MGQSLEVLCLEIPKDLHEGLGDSGLRDDTLLLSAIALVRGRDLDRGEGFAL